MNMESIQFEHFWPIRISLFGPNYLNTIQIQKYSLTSDSCLPASWECNDTLAEAIAGHLGTWPVANLEL